MQVIDDTTSIGVTTFELSDGSVVKATQNHNVGGAPFVVEAPISSEKQSAIQLWSGCAVIQG